MDQKRIAEKMFTRICEEALPKVISIYNLLQTVQAYASYTGEKSNLAVCMIDDLLNDFVFPAFESLRDNLEDIALENPLDEIKACIPVIRTRGSGTT